MMWRKWLYAPAVESRGSVPMAARRLNVTLAIFLLALALGGFLLNLRITWHWEALAEYWPLFLRGWLLTLGISVAALVGSTVLGLGAALAQRSRFLPLRYLAKTYVELIRGTPLLVQIYLFWYVFFQGASYSWVVPVGILTLSVFSGAYISEIFRAGMESVGRSQIESAKAIGLTRYQIYRYVVFPQALRQSLPPLAGQFASLIKDSSLLSVISVQEFTYAAVNAGAMSFATFETYLPLAVGYLVLTLPVSLWARHLEGLMDYET